MSLHLKTPMLATWKSVSLSTGEGLKQFLHLVKSKKKSKDIKEISSLWSEPHSMSIHQTID